MRPDEHEPQPNLLAPTEGQDIVADTAHTAPTLRRHRLALLRGHFTALKLKSAALVNSARHRQPVRAAGIVTCRQLGEPTVPSGDLH